MKIIQVVPQFLLAGAETMCQNLSIALHRAGHTVIAVSFYRNQTSITEYLERSGIQVVYMDKKPGPDISLLFKLYRFFQQEQPDVVHTHIGASMYALPAAIAAKVPRVVHTVHNIAQKENGFAGRQINKVCFKQFGVVPVALSDIVQETIIETYGLDKSRIPIVLNGVDLSKCIPKDDYQGSAEFKILHIGRFMDVKNHALLLNTFSKIVERHKDIKLQLIGGGELLDPMKQLAEQLGIAEKVEFLGLQSDVYPYLHDADVFVLPSKYEGVPMSLIEAMGTGLPIIASAVGGVPDMLTDGENALLIQPNAEELEAAMEKLYQNEMLRRRFGEKALERSVAFSSEEMARRYERIYLEGWRTVETR